MNWRVEGPTTMRSTGCSARAGASAEAGAPAAVDDGKGMHLIKTKDQ